uniref:Ig-like domain-containing protein n=1 Tax=Anopheles coluzzii TaxID=1518534 RepID=A0A6E8W087_ANOCL
VVEEPEFTDVIENVTVPAGRNVKLACSVKNLGSYKVAWMHFEQSAILTVHNHVITRNPRISVTHDKHDKHKTWFLHISNVQEEDKGRYMCQINTVTAKTQFGYLHVVVPPNIDDSLSSSDVIVREGSNVTLKCRATGSPTPTVKWKRDDNSKIAINRSLNGNSIEITKISRLDMGAYLCIASNGVPPTVSKRIKVSVDFPPMLWIPHQLVGVPLYFNVTLECFTEAHPTSLNYWTREDEPSPMSECQSTKRTCVCTFTTYSRRTMERTSVSLRIPAEKQMEQLDFTRPHHRRHLPGHQQPNPTPTFGPTGTSMILPVVCPITTVDSTRIPILGTWLIKTRNTHPI